MLDKLQSLMDLSALPLTRIALLPMPSVVLLMLAVQEL
jgi:hypothetical protein